MMFKINIYLRFALIALFLGGGILLAAIYGLGYSWILILIGLVLLGGYFLLGTVASAAEFIQVMDMDGAEKRLNLTFFPKLLYVTQRAIYFVLKGSIAAHRNHTKEAEGYFNKALSLNLPSDNEKGMVLLQMAGIQAKKSNWPGAKNYMSQFKKLKISEPLIKQQGEEFEKAIAQSGQANVARSMGKQGMQMMKQGGFGSKRRRPKMR